MGLGSTTKKIQTIADKAEQVYAQINEVRKQLDDLRNKMDTTHDTVSELEVKHEQNRALLEALAEEQGIDVEEVITEAAIDDAENDEPEAGSDERTEENGETAETGQSTETGPDASESTTGTETS